MISVRLGLHLDGAYTTTPSETLGTIDTGPLGLLGLLETYLGLSGLGAIQAQRVVQYRACLKAHNHAKRFYHQSFSVDELGVAAALLRWRDQWYLHGWDGKKHAVMFGRLADIADLEDAALKLVAPSIGERLQKVEHRLAERNTPISKIIVVDPKERWPLRWQKVLDRLGADYSELTFSPNPQTLLGQWQQRLIRGSTNNAPLKWVSDDSIRLVRSETRLFAGRWLAAHLATDKTSTLIVSGADGQLLDEIVTSAGGSRQGLTELSGFRPSLQVLPLAMALVWEPFDVYAGLEFLTHSICPIRYEVRRDLAASIAERPGLRRDSADEILNRIDAEYRDAARVEVDQWLFHPRHDQDAGAPLSELLARAQRLRQYFQARMADQDEGKAIAYGSAQHQCSALEDALGQLIAQGEVLLKPPQLKKLIAQASSNGDSNPLMQAEVGATFSTIDPGAVIEPVDHVIWWRPVASSQIPRWPWSSRESAALAEAGVSLPSQEERLRAAGAEWLRPILSARRSLTMVLPAHGEELHSVWQLLESMIENPRVESLEDLISRPSTMTKPLASRQISRATRWWNIPPHLLQAQPEFSSYSSLDLFINNPFQWVLKYPARLKGSRALSIPDVATLSGLVIHRLVEMLFSRKDAFSLSDEKLKDWISTTLADVVASDAAIFLMPGRKADLGRLQAVSQRTVIQLRQHLKDAGVIKVEPECELSGSFSGGALKGSADLIVTNKLGETAIVDMKWGGRITYIDKLSKNTHLQMIIYAGMVEMERKQWPRVAYYILKEARLLAQDRDYFPTATVVAPNETESPKALWNRFAKGWAWRRKQMDSGRIEVVVEGIEPDDDSYPPDDGIALSPPRNDYNEYLNLAGVIKP